MKTNSVVFGQSVGLDRIDRDEGKIKWLWTTDSITAFGDQHLALYELNVAPIRGFPRNILK